MFNVQRPSFQLASQQDLDRISLDAGLHDLLEYGSAPLSLCALWAPIAPSPAKVHGDKYM